MTTPSLSPEQIAQFQRDGFLLYPDKILTDDELAGLRSALDNVLSGKSEAQPEALRNMSGGDQVVTQIVNIWEAEPAFYDHLFHDRILPLVAQLMQADTIRVWHDQVQIKPPLIGGPTTWHQDHPYWPIIQPADLVSAWVALEDATISNGCMSMVAGSHKWGPYNSGTIGTDTEAWGPAPADRAPLPPAADFTPVPCEVKAGGVVFHHCLTWHGAPPNKSPNNRPAIAVHYMPGWTRYEPTDRGHIVEKHITVAPGEPLVGDHFPTVYENGKVLSQEARNN